jgi:hypothetical protein
MSELSDESKETLKEMTPDGLQALLKDHQKALDEEFDVGDGKESAESVRKRITRLVPEADAAFEYLLNNAESESVRLNAAKFVYEVRLGKRLKDADAGDAFKDLMDELNATPDGE